MMRRMGGWIEEETDGSCRVRTRVGGKKRTVAACATRAEAETVLTGVAILKSTGRVSPVDSLRTVGEEWLDRRETKRKLRGAKNDRNRWKNHVAAHPIADMPAAGIARRDLREWMTWLEERVPGWRTRRHCLNLLRGCFRWMVDQERRTENPAVGLTFERPEDEDETAGWTYLLPEEQTAFLTKAPATMRSTVLLAAFALGTGLRQGEQWNLELRDLHQDASPWLLVRWGSPGKPPKSGKVRRVPLFGIALAALKEWLKTCLPKENPHGLVFPTERGCRRQKSRVPRDWKRLLAVSGLADVAARHDGRSVRWHDLRHACASSLVAGWWGEPWALIEVREMLGHSTVQTTELYAHLAPGVLAAAAGRVRGTELPQSGPTRTAQVPELTGRAKQDSNLRPSASEGGEEASDLDALRRLAGHLRGTEEKYLRAVAGRNRFARTYGVELAEAARAFREAVEAVIDRPAPLLVAAGGGR